MNPFEFLKNLVDEWDEADTADGWDQIAKLSPEDLLREKNHCNKMLELAEEAEIHLGKAERSRKDADILTKEWWAHLHRAYGLPRNRSYKIKLDGSILMKPKDIRE